MDEATGEAAGTGLRVAFDRRLKLEFHGASVTSDAGLLAFRELDDALGLTALAAEMFADPRTGRNGRHSVIAQLRQSVFGRLAGYEDVNDADRLGRDPAMRWIAGGRAVTESAASTSQMGRFAPNRRPTTRSRPAPPTPWHPAARRSRRSAAVSPGMCPAYRPTFAQRHSSICLFLVGGWRAIRAHENHPKARPRVPRLAHMARLL
jgi:hypothetical protein